MTSRRRLVLALLLALLAAFAAAGCGGGDETVAEEARRRAEASIANRQDAVDIEQAQAELRRAALRLRIGQRRTGRRSPIPGASSE